MVDNNSPPTNLWDTLSSATTFDRGNNANSTLCLDNESNLNNRQIVSIVRTSSSLLIASLIQQLCILFEDDSVRRNKLYFAICDRLHKLELIDDSYNMMEFEPLRNQYQQALYHLFTVTRAAAGCENSLQISRSWINQTSSSRSQQNLDTGSSESPKENDKQDMLSQHSKWTNYNSEENVKKDEERTNSNSISFRNDSEHQNNKTENNTNYTDGSNSYEESSKNKMLLPYIPQTNKYTTLYIQMALCEKTLQQWLDERIEVTPQEMLIAILTQTLHGLDYIHSRGIVHHDIKPSNIFISTSGQLQIQLGDFGLACPLRSENHHSIIGTQMYAAPEQLQGKCDPKSDIYSLGIVLLELIVHTRTQMERIEIINSLKMGHIPTTLAATHLKWAHIVSQLVQDEPENRPSTNQLLQDLNEDKDMMIARLKIDIAKKDDVIQKLQERILILEEQMVKHSTSLQDI
ncbi:probable serine/threonine-protein kinase DDB_G0268642 isoform X4 [Bombus huntii]|uniref:probable serine/threonine-protein kinase DDB_G0268642 isoform X4 n=1 Tax=Bombus huntii TaxID=85661 RepID=UPI0021AA9190|nr:probable serine/threonine-protein kinase DDB_G0268642 isoform X4 [Bombus huntii]